ncbi:MAG: diaminopimelate epimerase, partial [Thermoanaerobaculia bacterium]
ADGGAARFCANGTRCAARFAFLKGEAEREMAVATGWGLIGAVIRADGDVTLRLPETIEPGPSLDTFDPEGRLLEPEAVSLSVGVPHLVVFTAPEVEVETLDVAALGPPLRRHPGLPDGANVNFVSVREGSRLSVRSYERGVEAETLSCGSGVVAAAVVAGLRRGLQPPIAISTRSGTSLVVDFVWDAGVARDVSLTGEARLVFEATLTDEAL